MSAVESLEADAPVVLGEQVEHLVAVAQLLGHHAEDPELLLLLLGAGEGQAVLLDRAELGRGLGADGAEEVVRRLGLSSEAFSAFGFPFISPHSTSLHIPISR